MRGAFAATVGALLLATSVSGANLAPIRLAARAGHVKKGSEKQSCFQRKFPRNKTVDVDRVQIFVHGGSHHVHLYRPATADPTYPPHDCPFAIDFSQWQLVAATQNENLDWHLHPGVGIQFLPHQPLLIQTHFVNTNSGSAALSVNGNARAKMLLHPMPSGTVKEYGGAIFAQDRTVLVPTGAPCTQDTDCPAVQYAYATDPTRPNPNACIQGHCAITQESTCALTGNASDNREMTVMAFTGHYHFRGAHFEVWRTHADGSPDDPVYVNDGYNDPKFQQYSLSESVGPLDGGKLALQPGDGFRWTCWWRNTSDQTYKFGPNTQMNEHCNLFGFYHPTDTPQEGIECIHMSRTGDPTKDNVRCGADGVACPANPPPVNP